MQLTDIHAHAILMNMTKPYGERFSDALVSEIKAEMGRRDLSSRALGRLIGKSSQYMSDRLDGGSAKTGKRVVLSVWDLAAIADAVGIRASDLTFRAHFLALGGDVNAIPLVANEEDPRVPSDGLEGGELIEGQFGSASTPTADVVPPTDDVDLHSVKLDREKLAASPKRKPVSPDRSES